jgi:hypothetical protein
VFSEDVHSTFLLNAGKYLADTLLPLNTGFLTARVAVKALCYKPKRRWFETQ